MLKIKEKGTVTTIHNKVTESKETASDKKYISGE